MTEQRVLNEDDIDQMFKGIGSALNITSDLIAFGYTGRNWEKVVVIDHALQAAYGMLQQIDQLERDELT